MIDRVAADLGRRLIEVPVGFKWFVPGLLDSSVGFGGEESAGASFLRRDGATWTTDKDGILLALLASEITAVTGKTPSEHYAELTAAFGDPAYARVDEPATREQKAALAKLSPEQVSATELAGDPIVEKLTTAPGNGAAIGGLGRTDRAGMVRGPPVRHRGRLQGLRRVLPRPRPPGQDPRGGPRRRLRRPGLTLPDRHGRVLRVMGPSAIGGARWKRSVENPPVHPSHRPGVTAAPDDYAATEGQGLGAQP